MAQYTGRPVNIVQKTKLANGNVSLIVNKSALQRIFCTPENRDKEIVVLSVAGARRTGKSFLLNFLLRFLCAQELNQEEEWLAERDKALTGFDWHGGSKSVTSGILVWSKLFHVRRRNGETVVVALMDTQGMFGTALTMSENVAVFACSALLSSVQVLNISRNIQEDDLQHLQLFLEYGKLVLKTCTGKPFQKLQFLVRDWSYKYEKPFGSEGGRQLLEEKLKVQEAQADEVKQTRQNIKSCFEDISCFLLPYPGNNVAASTNFNGCLDDIDADFIKQLEKFVHSILLPDNLIVKKVNGSEIKCPDFVGYCESYVEMLQSSEMPKPQTFFEATVKANLHAALDSVMDYVNMELKDIMNNFARNIADFDESLFEKKLGNVKIEAMERFKNKKKMGSQDCCEDYEHQMKEKIENKFADVRDRYNVKRMCFLAEVEASNRAAVDSSMDYVNEEMQQFINSAENYVTSSDLKEKCANVVREAMERFNCIKTGGQSLCKPYEDELKGKIEKKFLAVRDLYNEKRCFLAEVYQAAIDIVVKETVDKLERLHDDYKSGQEANGDVSQIEDTLNMIADEALMSFRDKEKTGGEKFARQYHSQLKNQINVIISVYRKPLCEAFLHAKSSAIKERNEKRNVEIGKAVLVVAVGAATAVMLPAGPIVVAAVAAAAAAAAGAAIKSVSALYQFLKDA